MNINIRESIKKNFKSADMSDIRASIESSIADNEEITLPGLGVFFEIVWKESDSDLQDVIIKNIEKGVSK